MCFTEVIGTVWNCGWDDLLLSVATQSSDWIKWYDPKQIPYDFVQFHTISHNSAALSTFWVQFLVFRMCRTVGKHVWVRCIRFKWLQMASTSFEWLSSLYWVIVAILCWLFCEYFGNFEDRLKDINAFQLMFGLYLWLCGPGKDNDTQDLRDWKLI